MKVLVGVPCPSTLDTVWVDRFERWTSKSEHLVATMLERTPNRMDRSISNLITGAKAVGVTWFVRLDADVFPELPIDDYLRMAEENRVQRGFAVTGCPTITETGLKEWGVEKDVEETNDRPFPVKFVSGSLVFTHRSVLDKMEPVGAFTDSHNKKMNFYIALQRPSTTEDYDFCERVTSLGFRVCADPRFMVQHRRVLTIPSYRPPMKPGEGVRVPLFEQVKEDENGTEIST